MHGRTVCLMHGGKTPRGVSSPHYKDGRYSKDLPTRLAELYERSEGDEHLLSVRQDIHLLDALLLNNLAKLDSGESAESWQLMRKAVDALTDGIAAEEYSKVQKALREMRDVINGRIAHYATEEEIRSKLEQRRKLVETEQRIQHQGERALTVEQAMLLVGALAGILKARINDTAVLGAIQADIGLLLSAGKTS